MRGKMRAAAFCCLELYYWPAGPLCCALCALLLLGSGLAALVSATAAFWLPL